MNSAWRRRLHRALRALGWTAGLSLIALAVLVALTQLLLPLLARHPQWVAAQIGERLHRPVAFATTEGRWTPAGPLFVMHGVTVGAAPGQTGNVLQIPQAELKLDFGAWLLPSRHLLNLHVHGLQLDLVRDRDGAWHVNGVGVAGGRSRQPLSLGPLSMDLWLDDLRIQITDARSARQNVLLARQLRLSREGRHIRFGGTLQRAGERAALRTAGRFREDGSAGRLWIGVDDVDLKPLLTGVDLDGYTAEGHGRLAAWLDWHRGRIGNSLLRVDLDALAVTAPDGNAAHVANLHGLAGLRRGGDGYELRWAGDDGGALAAQIHQPDGTPGVNLAARELQLGPLLPWLALKPALAPALAQWVGSGHPRGNLARLALHWNRAQGLQAVDLAFHDLGIDAAGKLPGVDGLRGELRGDAQAITLTLPPQATTLRFPALFRQPLALAQLGGTLAAWPAEDGWHLGVDAFDFAGAGYAGQARGEVMLPAAGGPPFMDMYVGIDHADVAAAKLFWPIDAMPPTTIQWLDRGLVAGNIDEAQVLVHGSLADWPFRHNEGRFEARAVLSGLALDYGTEWPRAEDIHAVASFADNGLLVDASAQSLGVRADHAVALIPDFAEPVLDLNVQGGGSGADLMAFVRRSPLGLRQADTLGKLQLGGAGTFDFHLTLPLKHAKDVQLDGTAQLHDLDVAAPDWNLQLDKLNGPAHFDVRGMQAGPLDATFHGQPSKLTLAIAGANRDPDTVLSATLEGSYRFADLVQDYPSLAWLGKAASGRSDFTVGFAIAHAHGSAAMAQALSIDSPLSGIALTLPAPLAKPAVDALPLHVSMTLPISGSDLQVALGDVMRGHFRLAGDAAHPLAATLAFGSGMPGLLPPRDLRIAGHARELDVTGWVQYAAAGKGGGGPGLESIDVAADDALWFGHALGGIRITAHPQPDVLDVDVAGAAMAGHFNVPTRDLDKRGVTVKLQHLYWPKDGAGADGGEQAPSNPAAASSTGVAVAQAPVAPATDPANTGINPASLPPFHLWVGDLRMGDARLGEARLESWPTAGGMHIDQLRALSKQVQINAGGDWNGTSENSHTHMHMTFAAEDLGDMLAAFGFKGLVNGGKTSDQLDATWPGSPSALSLATMDGTLAIHVSNGHIPEASSPGVGRLLGLVSLAELPRRLTLDFGDVFGKGLAFDSIAGNFRLAGGNATTDDLLIKAPVANITITGRTGLHARDYDQQLYVVPHVGNSLPVVGAVVGGPIGAAAGFAMQGLLGKGLNKAASARYRITGSWDKPVMTLVEKHGLLSRAGAASAAHGPAAAPASAGSVTPAPATSSGH